MSELALADQDDLLATFDAETFRHLLTAARSGVTSLTVKHGVDPVDSNAVLDLTERLQSVLPA